MNKLFTSLLVGILFTQPAHLFADEFDVLLKDVEYIEEELEADSIEIDDEESESILLSDPELFPAGEDEDDGGILEGGESHISVKVDGVPVVLQDVPSDSWFAPYVRDVADKGIVSGYRDLDGRPKGEFGPADNVTIEQLAKMAIEASNANKNDCTGTLRNETAKGSWGMQYILCAELNGWAVYSEGTIPVQRLASRAEVVVTVLQAFGIKPAPRSGEEVFTDVNSSTEFASAIESAANDAIVSGYRDANGELTGEFGPADPVNRAEVAKIIALAIQVYSEG